MCYIFTLPEDDCIRKRPSRFEPPLCAVLAPLEAPLTCTFHCVEIYQICSCILRIYAGRFLIYVCMCTPFLSMKVTPKCAYRSNFFGVCVSCPEQHKCAKTCYLGPRFARAGLGIHCLWPHLYKYVVHHRFYIEDAYI